MLADLHLHSCLSPCASLEMSPKRIAITARQRGLKLIALTDHNSARNTPAFYDACRQVGIAALYGLEITTAEECHVLALFDHPDRALQMDAWVYQALPHLPLNADMFGDQPVVDSHEKILELIPFLLISGIAHSFADVGEKIRSLGGLFIPAHINRAAFSVESQLGFLPKDQYDAIEVMPESVTTYRKRYPSVPVITGSDAHRLDRIGAAAFTLPSHAATLAGMRRALMTLTK